MEIRVGMYLRKKDNKRFSKKNRYPVVKVYETHPGVLAAEGYVIVNAAMKLKPEWVEEITEAEFDRIRTEFDAAHKKSINDYSFKNSADILLPKGSLLDSINMGREIKQINRGGEVKQAAPSYDPVTNLDSPDNQVTHYKKVKNPFPFHPGNYVRKKNWTFFHGSDVPAMKVHSIRKSPEAGSYYINKYQLYEEHLVKLTEDEATAINREFNDLSLAKVLLKNSQHTTCVRESTGTNKKVWTEKEALRYVFTYNKTNPGKEMNAYRCPHCNEIHVGKVPTKSAIQKDGERRSVLPRHPPVMPFKDIIFPNTWLWVAAVAVIILAVIYSVAKSI